MRDSLSTHLDDALHNILRKILSGQKPGSPDFRQIGQDVGNDVANSVINSFMANGKLGAILTESGFSGFQVGALTALNHDDFVGTDQEVTDFDKIRAQKNIPFTLDCDGRSPYPHFFWQGGADKLVGSHYTIDGSISVEPIMTPEGENAVRNSDPNLINRIE